MVAIPTREPPMLTCIKDKDERSGGETNGAQHYLCARQIELRTTYCGGKMKRNDLVPRMRYCPLCNMDGMVTFAGLPFTYSRNASVKRHMRI